MPMIDCRRTVRLLSERLDRRLTPAEQRRLQQHLDHCPACRHCGQQFVALRLALRG